MRLPKPISDLSDQLASLPGIGPKLSNRLALFLSLSGKETAMQIKDALSKVVNEISECSVCGNVCTENICEVCTDAKRDRSKVFVVEDSLDLISIESTGVYTGVYHVLNGVISPINGVGASDINLDTLIKRVKSSDVKEVILGTNPNVEGDATSMYIKNQVDKLGKEIVVTRLAKGIPAGSDIEFVSTQTIVDSLNSRKPLS